MERQGLFVLPVLRLTRFQKHLQTDRQVRQMGRWIDICHNIIFILHVSVKFNTGTRMTVKAYCAAFV